MKSFALSIAAFLFAATTLTTQAQTKTSGEPRATADPATGEMILLPAQSQEDAPAVLADEEEKEPVIKNVAHRRDAKIGKMVNGYYKMSGDRDWGTNARLNSYGYVTYSPKPYTPEDDQPIYPAGAPEEETGAESTTATETSTDGWGAPAAPTAKDSKKTTGKNAKPKTENYGW